MALYSLCVNCKKKIAYKAIRCYDCQKEYNKIKEIRRDKRKADFYRSYKWQVLRERVLKDNNYMCARCREKDRVVLATEVHHIEHLSDNWDKRLEYDNLIPLCYQCHHEIHNIPPYKN